MAEFITGGSGLGSVLMNLLCCDDIVPGVSASYGTCKEIFLYHPLGPKMAESPIKMAMSQKREIRVPNAPDVVVKAFLDEWKAIGADKNIKNLGTQTRIYGISSMGVVCEKYQPHQPIPLDKLADLDIAISVWDPLNTAGSLVLNQNPNAIDFQKHHGISVNGIAWAPSRTVTLMNEQPIYIAYTNSAFGFVGRSVYQRAFFPLKSFIQTMRTDDLVSFKAGVIIAKLKQAGSIITNQMLAMFGIKRNVVKEAQVGNVISIGETEDIETLNMQNLDGAFGQARKDILENCASACDMPAIILNAETFAEGFGEGSEDAKYVAKYVEGIREWLDPAYAFFDPIVQYRAWNEDFYKTVQASHPDQYEGVSYQTALMDWRNAFEATWPSLLIEPESEQSKKEDITFKSAIALAEVLLPISDQPNKAVIAGWLANLVNDSKKMFAHPLLLNLETLAAYEPAPQIGQNGVAPGGEKEPDEPRPFASTA